MILHRRDWQRRVLHRHDHAVRRLGCDTELLRMLGLDREEGMVAADLELLRDALEYGAGLGAEPDLPRLAVLRVGEHAELAAVVLDNALQAEADSEDGDSVLEHHLDGGAQIEVLGAAGAGREDADGRLEPRDLGFGEAEAQRRHGGAGLPQVVGERVHERVLVVDQQDASGVVAERGRQLQRQARRGGRVGAEHGVAHGRGLELGLGLLRGRVRVEEESRTSSHLGNAALDVDSAQSQAGVEAAVKADHAHSAAVPVTRGLLLFLDKLDGPGLGRAGHRHRPRVHEEGVERVETLSQVALDVVDGVDQPRVHLDLAPADDRDRAGAADTRLVVAIDIRAHGELRLLLLVREDGLDVLRILQRVPPAPDRA
mmetsp:Transcript_37491/g.79876  ORF Transcript_37491/g.79876 Transcript_37491/m.79876 type:complete len:371 (+) Transcript_37491:484-1596(+)